MYSVLKSELRKLLTVRSTYFITGFMLALVTFISIYVFGYQQSLRPATDPLFLADALYNLTGTLATFVGIISILIIAHEYRYNTINYTLSASNSRLKVLLAKSIVITAYTLIVGLLLMLVSYFGLKFGLSLKDVEISPQNFEVSQIAWQYTAYALGYGFSGAILALLIRGLVGSIVAFFLIPTAEGILSLILKGNTKFLPFRALDAIAAIPPMQGLGSDITFLSHLAALGVFSIYLVIFGTFAVVSFVRRDAS